jgi:hypothetical protein
MAPQRIERRIHPQPGLREIARHLDQRLQQLDRTALAIANSRGPETLAGLAKESGAKPVTAREAARAGEVVIVTIPLKNVARLPADLFAGVPADVVVVDTNNYYPRNRDCRIEAIENGTTESRWVSDTLRRPVVRAFNNIYARHLLELGKPKGAAGRIALPWRATTSGRRPFRPLDRSGLTCDRRGGAST